MDVTFVIPVRNDARRLARCLRTIRRELGGTPGRIVVVDNGSQDDSASVARDAGAEVLLVPGVPVAVARNRGVAHQRRGDVIAFVDADHELLPGWLDAARAALQQPDVVAAAAAYLGPAEPTGVQRWYAALRGETREGPIEWAGAGNLAVTRAVFEQIGGFDETLEACEDVDLCFRIRQGGGVLWGAPRMRSIHYGDPATIRHLFRGELWRGRDNIRVSLRGPWSARSLLSAILPIVQLGVAPLAAVGTAAGRSRAVAVVAAVVLVAPALARAAVLMRRVRPRSFADAWTAFIVCLTYDAARALALVWRAAHHSVARAAGTARPMDGQA